MKPGKIKTSVSSNGRNLRLGMTRQRFAALAAMLPEECEERKAVEGMLAEADRSKFEHGMRAELSQPLAPLTLARFGWNLIGNENGKDAITCGTRHGDFRLESDGCWSFGPSGAFDREDEGATVLRSAWQPGVFSRRHNAYALGVPTIGTDAEEQAISLRSTWHAAIPAGLRMRTHEDVEGLPEGARRAWGVPRQQTHMAYHTRNAMRDGVGGDRTEYWVYQLDVHLAQPNRDVLAAPVWTYGKRPYDPAWETTVFHYTGPLDCIVGKAWGICGRNDVPQIPGTRCYGPFFEFMPIADEHEAWRLMEQMAGDGIETHREQVEAACVQTPRWATAIEYDADNPFA